MPQMDGITASKVICNDLSLSVPIIALTADILETNKVHCYDAGMNDFLAKPVMINELKDMIKKYM